MKCGIFVALVLGCAVPALADESTLRVDDLRCEYLSNPLGIDVAQPLLSWKLQDKRRRVLQSAYQILVASSPERLSDNQGDLWDSGKVTSDQSIHVPYDGQSLRSHQRCFWKVRVWDQTGRFSPWSDRARWSMGILSPHEWQAEWLSYVKPLVRKEETGHPEQHLTLQDESWLEAPRPEGATAAQAVYFRRTQQLPANANVKWAYFQIAATGPFRLFVNGARTCVSADLPKPWKRAYEVELTEKLKPGGNVFAVEVLSSTGKPMALTAKLVIQFSDGHCLIAGTEDGWKALTHREADWNRHSLDDTHWSAARVGPAVGSQPWGTPQPGPRVGWSQRASSPLLRKVFHLQQQVRSATVTLCGLGYHELRLNGKKVGDHVLDPAFTRYDRRVLYVSHDVTDLLRQGENVVGVMLGNGWYNMHTRATWNFDQAPWRNEPVMRLHLHIELADGTTQTVVSDSSWRANTGPVVLDGIRAGEVYDAREERPGWDQPHYDDTDWRPPSIVRGPTGQLCSQKMPPIRVTQSIQPVSISEPRPGVFVFDLGQHMAGWVRLRVRGPAGQKVTLRYSERVDSQGMIERDEIFTYVFEGPFQTDQYILKGQGLETWEPRFSYHGFRYVEVTGFPGRPTLENITGRVVHTDFASAGEFECSNSLLNAVQKMTLWSYRGNFHGYPTDCPSREKNGWTADAHLAAEQAMFNFQNAAAYRKWIQDIADEQQPSGELPGIIPTGGWGYAWGNGPAWDSAFVIIPWYLYLYEGDTRPLEQHYDEMKRYVDYLTSRSEKHIVRIGLGDWVPARTETPAAITSTGYYYFDASMIAQVAELLGKQEDATRYNELARKIRAAFNRQFYRGDGIYGNGSQTALSCALFQGLADAEQKPLVSQQLAANVHAANDHLDVGILGAKYLFHTLSENGYHDLAYRIATQTTPPGYGDWVERGATTLWETWPGDESLNHIMFGDISAWFYRKLAGINPDPHAPGFKHIVLHPRPAGDLTWVRAHTESMYGTIRSSWRKDEQQRLYYSVSIPANTTATLYLPASGINRVSESGRPIAESTEIQFLRQEKEGVVMHIGSGTYGFSVEP